MAMGMQRIDIHPMVVDAQFTGRDLRTGTANSHQQSSTWTQRTRLNSRAAGTQQKGDSSRDEVILPYP